MILRLILALTVIHSAFAMQDCAFNCDQLHGVPLRMTQQQKAFCEQDAYRTYQECLYQLNDMQLECFSWFGDPRYDTCIAWYNFFRQQCVSSFMADSGQCSQNFDWYIQLKQNDLSDCLAACSLSGFGPANIRGNADPSNLSQPLELKGDPLRSRDSLLNRPTAKPDRR
jgi:hypothetical protein